MRLIETVFRKLCHQIKDCFSFVGINIIFTSPVEKTLTLGGHDISFLLTHSLTQNISLSQGVTRQLLRNLHNLFLIDDNAVGFFENRFKFRQQIFNLLPTVLTGDEIVDHSALNGAGTIESHESNNVLKTTRLETDQKILHAAAFKLKYPDRGPG